MLLNPLDVNPTKWSNILTQFVGNSIVLTNCVSVFEHFVILALKVLKHSGNSSKLINVYSPEICCANQLTGFYMRATLVLNELNHRFPNNFRRNRGLLMHSNLLKFRSKIWRPYLSTCCDSKLLKRTPALSQQYQWTMTWFLFLNLSHLWTFYMVIFPCRIKRSY